MLSIRREWDRIDCSHNHVASDGHEDEPGDESAVGLRLKLVLKLGGDLVAEDTREDRREGSSGGCDGFAVREGHDPARGAGQSGEVLVRHLAVVQPEVKPGTFAGGEPGSLVRGPRANLGLSFGLTCDAGLGETLVEGLVEALVETCVLTRAEVWLVVFSVRNLKDLGGERRAGFGAGKSVNVPTPGRETRGLCKIQVTEIAKIGLLLFGGSRKNTAKECYMSEFGPDLRTRDVLDRIRHSQTTLSVYDMPPDLAETADGQ